MTASTTTQKSEAQIALELQRQKDATPPPFKTRWIGPRRLYRMHSLCYWDLHVAHVVQRGDVFEAYTKTTNSIGIFATLEEAKTAAASAAKAEWKEFMAKYKA